MGYLSPDICGTSCFLRSLTRNKASQEEFNPPDLLLKKINFKNSMNNSQAIVDQGFQLFNNANNNTELRAWKAIDSSLVTTAIAHQVIEGGSVND